MTDINKYDFHELDYGLIDTDTLSYTRRQLPDDIRHDGDGDYVDIAHTTLNGQPVTIYEVGGAYQNAGAFISTQGHISIDDVYNDLVNSIRTYNTDDDDF